MYNGWTETQEQIDARKARILARNADPLFTMQRIAAQLDEAMERYHARQEAAQQAEPDARPLTDAEVDAAALAELQNVRAYFADVADQADAMHTYWGAKAKQARRALVIRVSALVALVIVVNAALVIVRMP